MCEIEDATALTTFSESSAAPTWILTRLTEYTWFGLRAFSGQSDPPWQAQTRYMKSVIFGLSITSS
jgi:hypothetical protein